MFGVLGIPGVDITLAAGAEPAAALVEPGEEGDRVGDLLSRVAANARCDVAAFSAGPESGKDVPGREQPDRLDVHGVVDAGQVTREPALEGADVFVDGGQGAAGHQEFFEVSGRSPGLEFVERVMSERESVQERAAATAPPRSRDGCGPSPARPARCLAAPSPRAGRTKVSTPGGCGRFHRPALR